MIPTSTGPGPGSGTVDPIPAGTPDNPRPSLYQRSWPAASEVPRALILVVHGLSEHSGRYDDLARRVGEAGFEVRAVDLYGHGRSPGPRGHIRSFDGDHLGAVDALVTLAERERPRTPLFLLGHSLGGLIAARWAQERVFASRLRGLVLVAPFVAPSMKVPGWKRGASRLLGRLAPSFTLPTGIADVDLFRTDEAASAFAGDPLVQRRISAGHWNALSAERERLVGDAGALRTPTLVLLAGEDHIISVEAARAFVSRLPDATVMEYDEAFHALHHDPVAEAMTADLVAWVTARLGADAGAR